MKVEESLRDLRSQFQIEKVMNKKQENMEKVLAMVTYAIGLLLGEAVRDRRYGVRKQTVFGRRDGGFLFCRISLPITIQRIFLAKIMMGKFLLWMRNFLTNKNCPN